jgi:hypothetical protein
MEEKNPRSGANYVSECAQTAEITWKCSGRNLRAARRPYTVMLALRQPPSQTITVHVTARLLSQSYRGRVIVVLRGKYIYSTRVKKLWVKKIDEISKQKQVRPP